MEISPDKQNLDSVFATTTYHIDFYQRDYRWTDEPVRRLLDDIFYQFRENYAGLDHLDPNQETVAAYPWYYLNTYVTNTVNGRVYLVDGQQRLTTLSLILMKLLHLAQQYGSRLERWIEAKIAGQHGYVQEFWMNHVGQRHVLQQIFDGGDPAEISAMGDITAENMVRNFQTIGTWLDRELTCKHCFETFVFYFLHRLVLINLAVEPSDVPMVFEAINDRGVRLRPYEVLKGKLLGQINKEELERDGFHQLWEQKAEAINAFGEDEVDRFFGFYLKAKYADTQKEGQRFEGDYHRVIFAPDMEERLGLQHSPARVKAFLREDFTYFAELYVRLREAYASDHSGLRPVYFCSLLDLDAPFLLGLSACSISDPAEDEKIATVAKEVDRLYSLLQLQGAYDSRDFNEALYRISSRIRDQDVQEYRRAFDEELTAAVAARRNVPDVQPLSYSAFRQTGNNLNLRFKRYFFARIDEFLASAMNFNAKHPLSDLVTKTGAKTGFHIEHILSWNEENLGLFGDEDRFEQERNRLGGILLLKGRDNISSNNETYSEKLKSYANTLFWNETLRADSYKSKLDIEDLRTDFGLDLRPLECFGPDELEERHRLLFEMVKIIWN